MKRASSKNKDIKDQNWNSNFNSRYNPQPYEKQEPLSDDEETKAFKENFRKQQQMKQKQFRQHIAGQQSKSPVKSKATQDNNLQYFQSADQDMENANKMFGMAANFMVGEKQTIKINNQGEKFMVLKDMTHKELLELMVLNPNDIRRKEVNKAIKTLGLNIKEVQNNYEIQQIILDTINGPPGWKRIQFEDTQKIVYWDMKKHQQNGTPDSKKLEEELKQIQDKYKKLQSQRVKKPDPVVVIPRPKEKPKPEKKKPTPVTQVVERPVEKIPEPVKPETPPKKIEETFEIDGEVSYNKQDDGSVIIKTGSYKVYTKFDFGPVDVLYNLEQQCSFNVQTQQDDNSIAIGIVQKHCIVNSGYSIKFRVLPLNCIFITSHGWLCKGGVKAEKVDFGIQKGHKILMKVNYSENKIEFTNLNTNQAIQSEIPQVEKQKHPYSFSTITAHSYDKVEIEYIPSQEEEWEPMKAKKPRFATKRKEVSKNEKTNNVTQGIYGEKAKDLKLEKFCNTAQCDNEKELDEHFNYKNIKLGKKEAFEDFKILAGVFHEGTNFIEEFTQNMQIIRDFGFQLDIEPSTDEFSNKLESGNYDICFMIASFKFNGDENKFLSALHKFVFEEKKSLYIGADNDPYFTHANMFLEKYFTGMKLTGDYIGTQMIYAGDEADMSHFNRHHSIAYGINNFYEGNTICHPINIHPDFKIFAYNSEDNPLILYSEQNKVHGRILVDNGMTRIYDIFWKLAGTDKLIANMVIWLSGVVS